MDNEMTPVKMPRLIWRITEFLPKECLLDARLVNAQWNQAAIHRIGAEFPLIMDGSVDSPESLEPKMEVLVQSKIEWKDLELRDLGFDYKYKILAMLEPISQKLKISCTSLALKYCDLQMKDFFVIIANLEKLEDLEITECPSILHSGLNVLQVWKEMEVFKANMKKLKRLHIQMTVQEPDYRTVANAIETWLQGTFQLEVFTVHTPCSPMPSYVMSGMLRRNAQTLTTLSLKSYTFDANTMNAIVLMSCPHLQTLSLCGCKIENPTQFSVFLQNQPALKKLFFQHMVIESGLLVFASIGPSHRLKEISFFFCDYALDGLDPLKTCNSLENIAIFADDRAYEIVRGFVNRNTVPQLSIVNLEIEIISGVVWQENNWVRLIPSVFPNLVSLRLHQIKCLQACTFRLLFGLPKLRELGLRNCEIPQGVFTPDLAQLPAFNQIEHLDLSGTDVKDDTVKVLVSMNNLVSLDLESTMVTKNCMHAITDFKAGMLKYLNIADFDDGPYSKEEYSAIREVYFPGDSIFRADLGDEGGELMEWGEGEGDGSPEQEQEWEITPEQENDSYYS